MYYIYAQHRQTQGTRQWHRHEQPIGAKSAAGQKTGTTTVMSISTAWTRMPGLEVLTDHIHNLAGDHHIKLGAMPFRKRLVGAAS